MKLRVAQAIVTLSHGGAERLALTILDTLRQRVDGVVCGIFGAGGPLEKTLNEFELEYRSMDAGKLGKIGSWRTLYKFFRSERIDILHVQAGYLLLYVFLPAKLAGVKIVYTEHAKHSIQTKPVVKYAVKLLAPFLDSITTVSSDLKSFFIEYLGISPSRVVTVPNGVDVTRFSVDGPSVRGNHIPDGVTVIGSVARMSEAKDHGNLLRAYAVVREKHEDVVLALVGDGETREEVEDLISEYGLEDSVLMLGRQDDVPAFLRAMDLFVLPSKREGAPISVLEAMSCGVPVVATDVGGVSEILTDGEDGRIVPSQDHDALAEAMLWMLEHPEKRAALGARGPEVVAARFSDSAMCEQYLSLYERVVS